MPLTREPWTPVDVGAQWGAQVALVAGFDIGTARARLHRVVGSKLTSLWRAVACAALVTALPLGAGCDPQEPGNNDARVEAAFRSARAVAANANFSLVTAGFRVDVGRLNQSLTDLEALGPAMRDQAKLRFAFLYALFSCAPLVEEDDDPISLQLSFVDCSIGSLELFGSVGATLEIETDLDGVATAATWTVDMSNLGARTPDGTVEPRYTPLEVSSPLEAGTPSRWTSLPGQTVELPSGLFASDASASWIVDEELCATTDYDSRLTLLEPFDVEDEVGDVALTIRGMHRCPGRCPDAGDVTMTFGVGSILQWSYTGEPEIEVIAPGGGSFRLPLSCTK